MTDIEKVVDDKKEEVDAKGLLKEISLILSDESDYLNIIIDYLDGKVEISGALRLLQRDVISLNNVLLKYLYD